MTDLGLRVEQSPAPSLLTEEERKLLARAIRTEMRSLAETANAKPYLVQPGMENVFNAGVQMAKEQIATLKSVKQKLGVE